MKERTVTKIANSVINFIYYYYLIFSVIGLLGYYFGNNTVFNLGVIFCMVGFIIEYMCGYIRGMFRLSTYLIAIAVSYIFLKEIWTAIGIGLLIVKLIDGIIKVIINKIIQIMIKLLK